MAPRRPHNKSRNGCNQCKGRRVKCDEAVPRCTACISRDEECQYSRLAARHNRSGANSNSNTLSPVSGGPPTASIHPAAGTPRSSTDMNQDLGLSCNISNAPFSPATRLRELELMHHWCTKTCHSFTTKCASILQGYAVEEALKHEYLMESILALTSLHIASELQDPVSAAPYVSAALRYQNNTIALLHMVLQNITPSNCNAVFASSLLMMACTIVSPLLPTREDDEPTLPTKSLLLLFDYVKGIESIVGVSRQWLEGGPFGVLFSPQREAEPLREDRTMPPVRLLRNLNDATTGMTNSPLHEVYERAIAQLEACFIIDQNMAVSWLVLAGTEFMDELRKGEPMAQIIFMYWGVLVGQLDQMWWAKYSGNRLVKELCVNLLGLGKEWTEAARWAMVQVGHGDIFSEGEAEFASTQP
jgi:hypothetical protein